MITALPQASGNNLASIIIPCFNQLEFTRLCVRSLLQHTRAPWELVVIDNGSTDGTAAYLMGLQDSGLPVKIITNSSNRGFPAAINQGLRTARGEYLVLLNNDTVVTDGWLEQLIALTKVTSVRIGLTGPMSNYVSPPQLVEQVPYKDMQGMALFARQWREQQRGKWSTVAKLSGFCLLLTRDVYNAIGGLDERFGLGFFDDDDLAVRARNAGYELALAHDLFIHHFGSKTFTASGIDAEALLEKNAQAFAAKWGMAEPSGKRVVLKPWAQTPPQDAPWIIKDGQPLPAAQKAKVSLAMIVRNEEKTLPQCLASVQGVFDEIVIVDTGSSDRTKEIAASFGARLFDFAWVDDFAAARNISIEKATGDYIFWLDADDVVEPSQKEKLLALLNQLPRDPKYAFVVRCSCDASSDGKSGETTVDHIRLFSRQEGIRWDYRVHEQILPSVRRAGIPARWTDITVRHTGYADPALRAKKLERDINILTQELAARPQDPFVLFNLGSVAMEQEQWRKALDYLRQSLTYSAPSDSITYKLFSLISQSHQMLGNADDALSTCEEGLALFPDDAELWFRKAVLHFNRHHYWEAENAWRHILTLRRPDKFSSVNPGIYSFLTYRNLANLAAMRGDLQEAARLWKAVLAECPEDKEAREQLDKLSLAKIARNIPAA